MNDQTVIVEIDGGIMEENTELQDEETIAIEKALNEGTSVEIQRQPKTQKVEVAEPEDSEEAVG